MTRKERFEQQKKMQEKAEKLAKSKGFIPVEHPEYVPLVNNKMIIIRPIDNTPVELWEDSPGWTNRLFYQTWLKGDDGKRFPFNWGFNPPFNHPVWGIARIVASGNWDAEARTMMYDNAGCPLLADISHNGNVESSMESGWKGTKFVLMNVIDRMDNWCQENKHTKVLVKDASWNEDYKNWNATPGAPVSIYNEINDLSEKEMEPFNGVDFGIIRYSPGKPSANNRKIYYQVYLPSKPEILEQFDSDDWNVSSRYVSDDTTEEEFNYGTYDFSSMDLYKTGSTYYFLKKKKQFVKAVDEKYGTSFFKDLSVIADEEKELFIKEREQEAKDSRPVYSKPAPKENEPIKEDNIPDPNDIVENGLDIDTNVFVGYQYLSAEEKAQIKGIGDGDTLIYVEDSEELDGCFKCNTMFPLDFEYCPKCGAKYDTEDTE